MGLWGGAQTRVAEGGEKDTSQHFQGKLILSTCATLKSGEDRGLGLRNLSLLRDCLLI